MTTITLTKDKIHTGHLILVNRDFPYKEEYANKKRISIETTETTISLEHQCARVYTKLMDDLRAWTQIKGISGWRSHQEQEQIYRESIQEHGKGFTAKYVALPGHSEHQTGLAIDLALDQPEIDILRPYFPYTGICGVFRDKAKQYGFIERYPQGKESITGIAHEPWHFRYVGAPHAAIMGQTGDTLEEYHERIKRSPLGCKPLTHAFGGSEIDIVYLAIHKETVSFEVDSDAVYTASGNNIDGFILTIWKGRR